MSCRLGLSCVGAVHTRAQFRGQFRTTGQLLLKAVMAHPIDIEDGRLTAVPTRP